MSDWPSNTPIGVSKFRLGRWKSAGGGTCLCVAEPGSAQSGTTGAGPGCAPAACARRCGAAHIVSKSSEARKERGIEPRIVWFSWADSPKSAELKRDCVIVPLPYLVLRIADVDKFWQWLS